MKILILSSIFPPHVFGGAEIAAYNMACLLARRGHEVSVATLREEGDPPSWGEKTAEGFRLYRLKMPRAYTLFGRTKGQNKIHKLFWHVQDLFDLRNKSLMQKLLDDVQPDQIDIHNIMGFGFNSLHPIARKDIPVIYFLHDFCLACFNTTMVKNNKACPKPCGLCQFVGFFRQKNLAAIKRIGFIAPTPVSFERLTPFVPQLQKAPQQAIKNVPERLPPLPERTEHKETRLVFVGRLAPIKGISFLLSVLDEIADKVAFHIDVLGTGELEPVLRETYKDKSWVTFHGFVPSATVACTVAAADLLCMPSVWPETYGLVTAQALQLGVPVLGSALGGTLYLVRDGKTGLLLPPEDKEAWREALLDLCSDKKRLSQLREEAISYRHEFDDEPIAAAYEAFVAKI